VARPIAPHEPPDEHARAFQHFEQLFKLDGSTRDASRLWYWPACCADTEQDAAHAMRLEGAPFDLDALIALPETTSDDVTDTGGSEAQVPTPATTTYASDDWFEALSEDDKVAELRALVATWTADKATEREAWFASIRIIADAAARGVPFDTALDIADEFSKRTTEKNLATRDEIAAKMREPGDKPSIYAAITAAENLGYVSAGRAKQIAAEFEALSDGDGSETPRRDAQHRQSAVSGRVPLQGRSVCPRGADKALLHGPRKAGRAVRHGAAQDFHAEGTAARA